MLYSNNSEAAIRACEEARTGFYGYDEGCSSEGGHSYVKLGSFWTNVFVEDARKEAMREMDRKQKELSQLRDTSKRKDG